MNDDAFLANVKRGLEDGAVVSASCLAAVMAEGVRRVSVRRRWRAAYVGLLAASLAVAAVGLVDWQSPASVESGVVATIELLSTVEECPVAGAGAAEILLAWQDAPYAACCADLDGE